MVETLMKDLAIFGAGGLGKEVACLIKRINEQVGSSTITPT